MRIAMIYPNEFIPCDGFRLIAALLRRDGHCPQLVSVPRPVPGDCTDQELRMLADFTVQADMVFIGVYSAHAHRAQRLTRRLKSAYAEIFALAFVPGSPLHERASRDGYIDPSGACTSRDFGSREILYQVSYPMLLILIWEQLYRHRVHRILPAWLLLLLACPPVASLMGKLPRPLMARLLRRVPPVIGKLSRRIARVGRLARAGLRTRPCPTGLGRC